MHVNNLQRFFILILDKTELYFFDCVKVLDSTSWNHPEKQLLLFNNECKLSDNKCFFAFVIITYSWKYYLYSRGVLQKVAVDDDFVPLPCCVFNFSSFSC